MKKIVIVIALAVASIAVANTGAITGVVTNDSNDQSIANILVEAFNYETGNWCGGSETDGNGVYEIIDLTAATYRVRASGSYTQYASEYYNNQINWDRATPVNVSEGQETNDINFSLGLGASVSGIVKNSAGVGQAYLSVACSANDGYWTNDWTEANGFYRCVGLPVGYNYDVIAYPSPYTDYMITKISVDVCQPNEYTGKDIVLGDAGFEISGKVKDKITRQPRDNIRVCYWNDDVGIWSETRTNVDGIYRLTNLPLGNVKIQVRSEPPYAWTGTEMEFAADIHNLNFALPVGATLCGKVLDAQTAESLAGIKIEYSNKRNSVYKNQFTDIDGTFCLTQLPPGIAEIKAEPNVDSGYAWNLPWGSDWVCLGEGENLSERIITLEKGALVKGYIKDANGNAFSGVEYYYSGRDCDGRNDTDVNGFYQIRLPVGTYIVESDDQEKFGTLPVTVTVTDVNWEVDVPDTVFYAEGDGGQISGEVNNPDGYAKTGCFDIMVFKAGTKFDDPNLWYAFPLITETEMKSAGSFSVPNLPPDNNYDIYLCTYNQSPDVESLAVQDAVLNVAVGTTGIMLEYNSQGSTVEGTVKTIDDKPVLGAAILLSDSSGNFKGFGDIDGNGEYAIYNVPAGTYTATALHSKYLPVSTTVNVVNGVPAGVNTVMLFAGEKEGPDLNGDSDVDVADITEFTQEWLESGSSDADFNQDGQVNFEDWVRIAENWLDKAIWHPEVVPSNVKNIRLIGGRNRDNYSGISAGFVRSSTSRIRKPIYRDATNLQLVYGNFYSRACISEAAGANNIVVKAAIEDSMGHISPVFFEGSRTYTIEPGGIVISDPVELSVSAGSYVYVRTFVDASSYAPYKYPVVYAVDGRLTPSITGSGGFEGTKDNVDRVDSGSIYGGNGIDYSAMMLLGEVVGSDYRSVAVIGDSIAAAAYDSLPDSGYWCRALSEANIPHIIIAKGCETLAHWTVDPDETRYRKKLLQECIDMQSIKTVIIQVGTNDLPGGNANTIISRLRSFATEFKNEGLKVYVCTILPRLAHSPYDNGLSIAGQLAIGKIPEEAARIAINTSVRNYLDGAPGQYVDGFIEVCTAVEVNENNVLTQNGGLWWVPESYIEDGTATPGTGATILYDWSKYWSWQTFQHYARLVEFTSGAASGKSVRTTNHGNNYINFSDTVSPAPSAWDTYKIWGVSCADGIHPQQDGHAMIAEDILPIIKQLP